MVVRPPQLNRSFLLVALIGAAFGRPAGAEPLQNRTCPSVTTGWLDYGRPKGDSFVFWLIELKRDGTIQWGKEDGSREDVTLGQLANRLRNANEKVPFATLLIGLDDGANCDTLRTIRDVVERDFGCKGQHSCRETWPPPPPSSQKHAARS